MSGIFWERFIPAYSRLTSTLQVFYVPTTEEEPDAFVQVLPRSND